MDFVQCLCKVPVITDKVSNNKVASKVDNKDDSNTSNGAIPDDSVEMEAEDDKEADIDSSLGSSDDDSLANQVTKSVADKEDIAADDADKTPSKEKMADSKPRANMSVTNVEINKSSRKVKNWLENNFNTNLSITSQASLLSSIQEAEQPTPEPTDTTTETMDHVQCEDIITQFYVGGAMDSHNPFSTASFLDHIPSALDVRDEDSTMEDLRSSCRYERMTGAALAEMAMGLDVSKENIPYVNTGTGRTLCSMDKLPSIVRAETTNEVSRYCAGSSLSPSSRDSSST